MRTPLFIANWKMNKFVRETADYVSQLSQALEMTHGDPFEVVLAAPATHLGELVRACQGKHFGVCAQNCGTARFGAFTGEISPAVLKEMGCDWVILGHSERRHVFGETDALILSRLKAALESGLHPVLCVGEVLAQRKEGKTIATVERQLSILTDPAVAPSLPERLTIAYEPVWAIGTGENATPEQAEEVHQFIRGWIGEKFSAASAAAIRILYGGSVKPENSGPILDQKDVDGLLVGTASLDPAVFAGVIRNGLGKK